MTPDTPQQAITPGDAPTPPPVFASSPQGKKPKNKSQNTTFLGSATPEFTMPAGSGKTLLGG